VSGVSGRANAAASNSGIPTSPNSVVATTTAFQQQNISKGGLTEEQALEFCEWFQGAVGKDKVVTCTPTCKFVSQPARVTSIGGMVSSNHQRNNSNISNAGDTADVAVPSVIAPAVAATEEITLFLAKADNGPTKGEAEEEEDTEEGVDEVTEIAIPTPSSSPKPRGGRRHGRRASRTYALDDLAPIESKLLGISLQDTPTKTITIGQEEEPSLTRRSTTEGVTRRRPQDLTASSSGGRQGRRALRQQASLGDSSVRSDISDFNGGGAGSIGGTRNLEDFDCAQATKAQSLRHVEINPVHPLIVEIAEARQRHAMIANLLAEQVYDNCLINAGVVLQDSRAMVNRMNDICVYLLREKNVTK